jgi:hypothetical protein
MRLESSARALVVVVANAARMRILNMIEGDSCSHKTTQTQICTEERNIKELKKRKVKEQEVHYKYAGYSNLGSEAECRAGNIKYIKSGT